jgi:leishmanolysin
VRSNSVPFVASLIVLAACHDASAPVKPAAIKLVAGNAQTGTVGQPLGAVPTFEVYDGSGAPLGGVKFTVGVKEGGGHVTSVPSRTSAGPTGVGVWTLGPRVGVNSITVTVGGLEPLVINATARAGAAQRIVPSGPTTFVARVGEPAPGFTARLLDGFDNPVGGETVNLTLAGGGAVSAAVTSDQDGTVAITDWILSQTAGRSVLTLTSGQATLSVVANLAPGDPTQLVAIDGDKQSAFAGTAVDPIHVRVADRYGNGVPNQPVSLAVSSGGGSIAAPNATSGADGVVTVPAWTLGRSALAQGLRATTGAIAIDVTASVKSDYNIDVRFFGPEMTDEQRALFTNAAARISGVVVGDVPDATFAGTDVSTECGIAGLPTLNETIDDLVIYASVQDIDGAGRILAEAGPCVFRPDAQGNLTAIGVMLFDSADLASMTAQGTLQDVITHEMLHVVGIGTLWSKRNLIVAAGTSSVAYIGAQGRVGCVDDGGTNTCATSVPVENNGVPGTADAHWREYTFGSELMTGYVNSGGMQFSAITIGSLADIGYMVNPFAADPYRVPLPGAARDIVPAPPTGWEKRPGAGRVMP